MEQENISVSQVNKKLVFSRLCQRVSDTDAKLRLQSAAVSTGLNSFDDDSFLNNEEVKALCLALIKQGGPAFQVGHSIYKEYLQ